MIQQEVAGNEGQTAWIWRCWDSKRRALDTDSSAQALGWLYPTGIRCHLTDSLAMTLLTRKNTRFRCFLGKLVYKERIGWTWVFSPQLSSNLPGQWTNWNSRLYISCLYDIHSGDDKRRTLEWGDFTKAQQTLIEFAVCQALLHTSHILSHLLLTTILWDGQKISDFWVTADVK